MANQVSATFPADPADPPPVRRRRRSRSRPIEDLTLTVAQAEEGRREVQRLGKKKTGTDYHKDKKRRLMKIVKCMDQNGGERFLRVQPSTASWSYPKVLDILKVEAEQEQFFELFSTYLGCMQHKKLKFRATGQPQKVRHSTIKKFCTALNSAWADAFRQVPYKLTALTKDLKSNKMKIPTPITPSGRDFSLRNAATTSHDTTSLWYASMYQQPPT